MNTSEILRDYPWLKYSFFTYLALGFTDTIHHIHAAKLLGQDAAMHAAWIGIVLIPIVVFSVLGYVKFRRRFLLRIFIGIALLAALVPGIYHGGWNHLVKILGYLRLPGATTDIRLLFPSDNINLWFYEIIGVLEFFLALITLYCLGRLLVSAKTKFSK